MRNSRASEAVARPIVRFYCGGWVRTTDLGYGGLIHPHRHDRLHPQRAPHGDDAGEQAHRQHERCVGHEQRGLA